MSGSAIALDTSAAIAFLNRTGEAGDWIDKETGVFLPVPVIGELRFGAMASRRIVQNLKRIEALVAQARILDITLATTDFYGRVRAALKKSGKPIPENDVWIAALCLEYNLPLATSDGHFSYIEGLMLAKRPPPSR